jgi:L-alanine-DL-glutamate epimerase-like enolase superfamily enzyme
MFPSICTVSYEATWLFLVKKPGKSQHGSRKDGTMKITDIEVIPVWFEPSDLYHRMFGSNKAAGSSVHAREAWFANIELKQNVFVKIFTDEGIVGWGEAAAHPVTGETQEGIVATLTLFAKQIMGMNPFHIGAVHAKLDGFFLHGNAGARCAIDIALYDIMGQASGQPIYNLLGGGFQTEFGLMATTARETPEKMAEQAAALIEKGYTCFEPKMTGHLESLDADADRLEAILGVVPKSALVMADPNQTWGTAKDSIELLQRRFAGVQNLAVEQPVMYHDLKGLAEITRAVPQKIIADEAITSVHTMIDIAAHHMADMISVKLGKCGGFYKAMQIIRMAEAASMPVRIDWTQGSRLLDTATGHMHAAVRLVACDPGMDYHLRIKDEPVAEGGAQYDGGNCTMPDGPGLGLTVDEDLVRRLSERS